IIYVSRLEETAFLGTTFVFAAAGILTLSGLILLYLLYRKKDTYSAITTMSVGILLTIFVAGFSMPQLNPYLGWRDLCEKAETLALENNISDYWVYGMRRAENMDVYLGTDVKIIQKEDLTQNTVDDKIVLLPEKKWRKDADLRQVVESNAHYKVGDYTIVVF
ncbi:MAG TPA: hypothetical protein PKZ45_05825, partial [Dysgonamonadaceae bacterium]|nr:hypothetical protein [Dysgonamonadaceae bacterium]